MHAASSAPLAATEWGASTAGPAVGDGVHPEISATNSEANNDKRSTDERLMGASKKALSSKFQRALYSSGHCRRRGRASPRPKAICSNLRPILRLTR